MDLFTNIDILTLVFWYTKARMLILPALILMGGALRGTPGPVCTLPFGLIFIFMVKPFFNYYCLFRKRPINLKHQNKTKQNTFASDLCQLSNNTWHLIFLMSYVLSFFSGTELIKVSNTLSAFLFKSQDSRPSEHSL